MPRGVYERKPKTPKVKLIPGNQRKPRGNAFTLRDNKIAHLEDALQKKSNELDKIRKYKFLLGYMYAADGEVLVWKDYWPADQSKSFTLEEFKQLEVFCKRLSITLAESS